MVVAVSSIALWATYGVVLASASGAQPTRLRITSACSSEPMWIAHEAANSAGPDPQNNKIEPMQSFDFTVHDNLKATRYWPKFRCNADGNGCELGGSGGPGEVCEKVGCAPAIDSKFEATFGEAGKPCNTNAGEVKGCDWLDVSLVDGFTVPFKLIIKGDCGARFANKTDVNKIIDCSSISVASCPKKENLGPGGSNINLQAVHPRTRQAVGCYSPCSKLTFPNWNNDIAKGHSPQDAVAKDYCCPTPPESPEQCRTGPVKDTEYVKAVHHMCPGVYGFSYDDGVGLLNCPAGISYEMIFHCPESPAPSPGPSPVPGPSPPTPPSPRHCNVGDSVKCPGASASCAGDQCCPDGSTCPSANVGFKDCAKPKSEDCTKSRNIALVI